jgi:hypothetical protein
MKSEQDPAYKGAPPVRRRLTPVPAEFRGTTKDGSITAETSPLQGKVKATEVYLSNKNPRRQA